MLKLEPQKEIILKMFDQGSSFADIARELGEYDQAVSNLVRRYRDVPKKKEYSIDEEYFRDIDSVDSAYFFGLIAADGAIVDSGKTTVMTISLQEEDDYILHAMKSYMKAEVPIRYYKQSHQKEDGSLSRQARFVTANKKICNSLLEKEITRRKSNSLNKLTPYIHDDYVVDFIRGYFDGNGSIVKTVTSGTKKKNYISFTGSYNILQDIQDWLVNQLDITKTKIYFNEGSKKDTGTYAFRFGAVKDVASFKKNIYHENIKDLYLTRKLKTFIE